MEKTQEITEKARKLFLEYGIRSVSMDDIAKELSISKKTLYQLFKDKADLVKHIIILETERIMKEMQEQIENAENSIDRMLKINEHLIRIRQKTPKKINFDLKKYYPEILEELKKNLEMKMMTAVKENHKKGQEEGLIRTDMNLDVIAALQVNRSAMIDNMAQMLNLDYETILNEIFDYHIRAIATQKGIEYYKKLKNNKK